MFVAGLGLTTILAQFSQEWRAAFDLGFGEFGMIYMGATLLSALTLSRFGKLADQYPARITAAVSLLALAVAACVTAFVRGPVSLFFALYLLRFFGQGMLTHLPTTATSKWFSNNRGKALSIVNLGILLSEALVPLLVFLSLAQLGWRQFWLVSAACVVVIALPITLYCYRQERTPNTHAPLSDGEEEQTSHTQTQATKAQVLREPAFYLLSLSLLMAPFAIAFVLFHQSAVMLEKGWDPVTIPQAMPLFGAGSVAAAMLCGVLTDRFTARRLLAPALLPVAAAMFVLGIGESQLSAAVTMFLAGLAIGTETALAPAALSETYGTRHLGDIRGLFFSAYVVVSALSPGVTGLLIDWQAPVSQISYVLCALSVALTIAVALVFNRKAARKHVDGAGSHSPSKARNS